MVEATDEQKWGLRLVKPLIASSPAGLFDNVQLQYQAAHKENLQII
jgi:hypothetical protein